MEEVIDLVNDIRRLKKNIRRKGKKKKETIDDFVKRKFGYCCVFCQNKTNKKHLSVSIEPCHFIKEGETLEKIINYYKTSREELEKINQDIDLDKLAKGDIINVPSVYKIFPNTHGICYCKKCAAEKKKLKMNHTQYYRYIIEKRRKERDLVTPEFREKIFKRDNYECLYCIIEFEKTPKHAKLTIDHKKPIVKGGKTTEENCLTCCLYHNKDKGKEDYEDYVEKIKYRKINKSLIV